MAAAAAAAGPRVGALPAAMGGGEVRALPKHFDVVLDEEPQEFVGDHLQCRYVDFLSAEHSGGGASLAALGIASATDSGRGGGGGGGVARGALDLEAAARWLAGVRPRSRLDAAPLLTLAKALLTQLLDGAVAKQLGSVEAARQREARACERAAALQAALTKVGAKLAAQRRVQAELRELGRAQLAEAEQRRQRQCELEQQLAEAEAEAARAAERGRQELAAAAAAAAAERERERVQAASWPQRASELRADHEQKVRGLQRRVADLEARLLLASEEQAAQQARAQAVTQAQAVAEQAQVAAAAAASPEVAAAAAVPVTALAAVPPPPPESPREDAAVQEEDAAAEAVTVAHGLNGAVAAQAKLQSMEAALRASRAEARAARREQEEAVATATAAAAASAAAAAQAEAECAEASTAAAAAVARVWALLAHRRVELGCLEVELQRLGLTLVMAEPPPPPPQDDDQELEPEPEAEAEAEAEPAIDTLLGSGDKPLLTGQFHIKLR
jgi:hypothetical protein